MKNLVKLRIFKKKERPDKIRVISPMESDLLIIDQTVHIHVNNPGITR